MQINETFEPETTVKYGVEEYLPARGSWTIAFGGPDATDYLSIYSEAAAIDRKNALDAEEASLPEDERATYRVVKYTTTIEKKVIS